MFGCVSFLHFGKLHYWLFTPLAKMLRISVTEVYCSAMFITQWNLHSPLPFLLNLAGTHAHIRQVGRAALPVIVQSPAVATQHPRWNLFSVSISVVGGRQTTKWCVWTRDGVLHSNNCLASSWAKKLVRYNKKTTFSVCIAASPSQALASPLLSVRTQRHRRWPRNLKAKQWHVGSSTRYKFTHP